MPTYIALLRGINVSGQKAIPMAELRQSLAELRLVDVRTYLQSGNVVFRAPNAEPAELAAAIRGRIAADFGHQVEVLVLACADLAAIAASNPFYPRLSQEQKHFHCTFLFEPVSQARFAALELPVRPGEEALCLGRAILLYCPHGYGRTKINNTYFERKLGVAATTRNWRTVLALRDLCGGSSEGDGAAEG